MPIRKFDPLAKGHPAIGTRCYLCDQPFGIGDVTAPLPVEQVERNIARAELVHYQCILAAEKILGPLENVNEETSRRLQKP